MLHCHDFIAIYGLSIHQLLNVWVAKFSAVLLVFTSVPNTTSTPIGVESEGGLEPRSGRQRLQSY